MHLYQCVAYAAQYREPFTLLSLNCRATSALYNVTDLASETDVGGVCDEKVGDIHVAGRCVAADGGVLQHTQRHLDVEDVVAEVQDVHVLWMHLSAWFVSH